MIPKFKFFYKPVLEAVGASNSSTKDEIIRYVCLLLNLSLEDRLACTQSGRNIIYDRVTWALVYLKKANMINIKGLRPAHYSITKKGKMLIDRKYEVIDNWILGQFSEDFAKYQYIPQCVKCAKRTL